MNQGNTVQIEAPNFDPDIDRVSLPNTEEKPTELTIQGTLSPISEVTEPEDDNSLTSGTTIQQLTSQEIDWHYPSANPTSLFIDSPARRTGTYFKPGWI